MVEFRLAVVGILLLFSVSFGFLAASKHADVALGRGVILIENPAAYDGLKHIQGVSPEQYGMVVEYIDYAASWGGRVSYYGGARK